MPTELQIAWAAGIIEGEAWLGSSGNSARVAVAMVDQDVVTRLAEVFELSQPRPVPPPKSRPNRQMQWGVYASGRKALGIMNSILPYLGERRSARVAEVARLMGQKYDPRPCVECGELFVPALRATLGQKYCAESCRNRAKKRRVRVAEAAAAGREVGQRCAVATRKGPCRNYPVAGRDHCRHHGES